MQTKTSTSAQTPAPSRNPSQPVRAEAPRHQPSRPEPNAQPAQADGVQLSHEVLGPNPASASGAGPEMSGLLSGLSANFGPNQSPDLSGEVDAPSGNLLQRGIENVAAFGGSVLGGAVETQGRLRGAAFDVAGNLLGGTVGEGFQARAEAERALYRGAGNALEDTVNGFGQIAAHPLETGAAVGELGFNLVTEPRATIGEIASGVSAEFQAQREEGGLPQALGYAAVQVADLAVGTRGAGTFRRVAGAGVDGANRLLPPSIPEQPGRTRAVAEALTQPLSPVDEGLGLLRERLSIPSRVAEARSAAASIRERLTPLGNSPVTPDVVADLLNTRGIGDVIDGIDQRARDLDVPRGAQVLQNAEGQALSGRRNILNALGEQGLSPGRFQGLVDGLLDNGSIDRQAHLLNLPADFEIGRRFDSRADSRDLAGLPASGQMGGFWSPAADVLRGTPGSHVRNSALPGYNDARRLVTGRLSEPTTALLTEVAPRHQFGFNRVGGGLQLQGVPWLDSRGHFLLRDTRIASGTALPFHRFGELGANPIDLFEDFAQEEPQQ